MIKELSSRNIALLSWTVISAILLLLFFINIKNFFLARGLMMVWVIFTILAGIVVRVIDFTEKKENNIKECRI